MMNIGRSPVGMRRYPIVGMLLLATVLVVAPLKPAHAYIDPNSAGPLYQFLFPLFIAIAGAIAALRRIIRELWIRALRACVGVFRHERTQTDNDRAP